VWNFKNAVGIATIIRHIRVGRLLCILLASLCPLWCGQRDDAPALVAAPELSTSASTGLARDPTNIRVNSDLVVIPVTVTDGKGHVVDGLQKEHFALYEDKVEQQITHFASQDAPVSIGLVFDTSDSMAPKLQRAREAVAALLNNTNPEDEFFLVQFNDHAQLLVNLTKQTEEIRKRVAMMEIGGTTALLDAVTVALHEMRNARHNRKAIIIISDGEDNASHCSVRDLKEEVREGDVLIYAIGIADSSASSQGWPPPRLTGAALLDEIATQTGGRLFEANRLNQLPGITSKISEWLRKQYVLAYTPNNTHKNGGYRHVQIKITKPSRFPRLHAFWRLGYYAPAE
jgi:Ca-activated chloride channel family protein